MRAAVRLRDDFDGALLWALAKRCQDGAQARRLLALAEIYDGVRRSGAARLAGVGHLIVRDWVIRFNAEGPDRADRAERLRPAIPVERCAQGCSTPPPFELLK